MKGLRAIRSAIVLGQRLVKLRPDLYTSEVLEGVIKEYLKMNYVAVEEYSIIPYRIALHCNLDRDTHLLDKVLEDTKLLKKFMDEHSSVVLEELIGGVKDEDKHE